MIFKIKKRWGRSESLSKVSLPLAEMADIIEFPINPGYLNANFLHQKYIIEGLSCEEISGLIGSARTTVLKYLKRFNIPVRESGVNINRKRGLGYGRKIAARSESTHQRETENIKKMRELRDKGFSYWKIADVLNAMNVPTKTRKGKWHAKSVHQILNFNQSDSPEKGSSAIN
ncbi:MAG: recombinase family protein [Oligoflexia bacterium]|nr:recombinase family protein [Oligoflexia bacterium]